VTTIHMSATEAVAECNQLLHRLREANGQTPPDHAQVMPITRRQEAAIQKLIDLAMPEALGQRQHDPQRRHR
jgi:hypothetical protein